MNARNLSDSVRIDADIVACEECGSTSRVGRGFCLNCLLHRGLGCETEMTETLQEVLDEVDVRDADWRIGNYQILEEIGRGGMGVIYRARQRHSRRIVALKRVLSFHADSRETLGRFRREAEAAASLDHPNILPIYEVSESDDGLPFFSMKFASGGSLLDAARNLRDDPRRIVALMAKVTRAVQCAHLQGILHRDLKPGNILLDGRGEPLVSDFGLAKWLDAASDLTRTLTVFGTPGYIAPEQAHGPAKNLTPAADIYSIGAVLFDLFTGRTPFLGEHALAVIKQASDKPAPKLRTLAPLADRDVETICAKCLEREPQARYGSAGDLAEDLERWLEGRPIIARPVSPPVRIWRWSKRNPKLAGSLAACVLAITAAAVWQIQSRHLAATVREEQLAAHSIAVLPFLNLDEIGPDVKTSSEVANVLGREIAKFGFSKVKPIKEVPTLWTGAGIQDEIAEASRKTQVRAVLAGTTRQVADRVRISLHMIRSDGTSSLGNWLIDKEAPTGSLNGIGDIARPLYAAIESSLALPAQDPVMGNDRARRLFTTGTELIGRRTIADMDRAIACFEGAIREEPRSVSARSYLAMAYMGRDMLTSQPDFMEKALRLAREAVGLAPNDPTANRASCAVNVTYGKYREAIDYGFRALEFGDRSERAFGQIAFSWHMAGRPDKAIKWYEKAKGSQHQPADYESLLGDCWIDLCQDDRAGTAYQLAADLRPDQPDGWIGLCRLKLLARDWDGAREIYKSQIDHYTGSPAAKEMAAFVELYARRYDAALQLYTELAKVDPLGGGRNAGPGAVDYRSALARLKLEAKDRTGADALLRDSITAQKSRLKFAPNDMMALYNLAAAEAMIGDATASLRDVKSAIESGWIDYRSTQLDPRFDAVRASPEFQRLLSDLATHVAELGRQSPAVSKVVSNQMKGK
jgi:serine/threonine protein kinase/tetratricopeptide (TPR) repeat protein